MAYTVFQVEAEESVKLLGLTPDLNQSDAVFVQAVHPQTWASRAGIRKGDELLCVNGEDANTLSRTQLGCELRKRPLHLRIRTRRDPEGQSGMVRSASAPGLRSNSGMASRSEPQKTIRGFREHLFELSCPGNAAKVSKRPENSPVVKKPTRDFSNIINANVQSHPAERTTAAVLWKEMEETIARQDERIKSLTAQLEDAPQASYWGVLQEFLRAKNADEAWKLIQTYKQNGLTAMQKKELACKDISKDDEMQEFQRRADFVRIATASGITLDKFIAALRAEVTRVLEADRCSIYFLDEVRKELWCVGAIDWDDFHIPMNEGIAGLVVSEGNPVKLDDAHDHPQFNPGVETKTGYFVKSMLALPIKHHGEEHRTIGVIQVLNKKTNGQNLKGAATGFSDQDLLELYKITTEITDAFSRQRWTALEISASKGDRQAISMVESLSPIFDSVAKAKPASRTFTEDNVAALQTCIRDTTRQLPKELSQFPTIDFNAFGFSADDLMGFVIAIFQYADLVDICGIPSNSLQKWTQRAMRSYRDCPFHSWTHGFSVFHVVYVLLFSSQMHLYFRNVDLFGLLVAGLCHDMEHPGVNNTFLVNNQDQLAIRYNETSVLENHHAACTIALMKNEDSMIDTGLSCDAVLSFRRTILRGILATDMCHHHDMCQKVMCFQPSKPEDVTSEDRNFLIGGCIHAADLSGQCYRWSIASEWEERISLEFSRQATKELELGQVPAPFMNFKMDDIKLRGKLQRDFVDFVLVPLWDPYSDMWPGLRVLFTNLLSNRAAYDYRSIHGKDETY